MKNTYGITQINRIVKCPQCSTILDGIEIDLDDSPVCVGQIVAGWFCCDECGFDICDDYRIVLPDVRQVLRSV